MSIDLRFLSSRVARRIFTLFVVCALVPITALAVISFGQVNGQLYAQGRERLDTEVRAVGQGVAERLLLLESELGIDEALSAAVDQVSSADGNPLTATHFTAVVERSNDVVTPLAGTASPLPDLSAADYDRLAGGLTLLTTRAHSGEAPLIVLSRSVEPDDPRAGVVSAVVNPRFLWAGGADTLPRNNDLCVLDDRGAVLFCTRPTDGVLPGAVMEELRSGGSGELEWTLAGDPMLASYWSLPLDYGFGVSHWTFLLSESRASLLAPMAGFRRVFPLVVLISLWVVLLLSIGQIRRNLIPLEHLREGTRRIAERQFDSRVEVDSGDEFEELADSFNEMAERLGKQFSALATISEIDRTILSSLDMTKIVRTVLHHATDLIPCDAVSLTVVAPDQQKIPRAYSLRAGEGNQPWVESVAFSSADLADLDASPEVVRLGPGKGVPPFLAPLARIGCSDFVILPMYLGAEPSGAISLAFVEQTEIDAEDLEQARQLADQVAVALANARLVEDLDALNWGALTALARTVDAKSPWTAGHSERVTRLGLKIGRKMGLGADAIDILHRGGLLHDIGKIGVPAAILDKPGRLTAEEYEVMKRHPGIGANILQPIAAYAEVIPIVLQHHERWDGSGYPSGLAGTRIHLHARIFAVADVYDALISDRPYREGLGLEKVIGMLAAGEGTEFDPEVVNAFLKVMTDEGHSVFVKKAVAARAS